MAELRTVVAFLLMLGTVPMVWFDRIHVMQIAGGDFGVYMVLAGVVTTVTCLHLSEFNKLRLPEDERVEYLE